MSLPQNRLRMPSANGTNIHPVQYLNISATANNFDDLSLNESNIHLNESRDTLFKQSSNISKRLQAQTAETKSLSFETSSLQPLGKTNFANTQKKRIQINFGPGAIQNPSYKFKSNYISTTKYSIITWIPKSLILQFRRIANIYFLIITVLTNLSFSPKQPVSQIATFAMVLVFTMLKEGYEDLQRYRQDLEVNNAAVYVLNPETKTITAKKSQNIKVGDMVRVQRDQAFPADILILSTSSESGIAFVNTMNLDGETNLKEKICLKDIKSWQIAEASQKVGRIECEAPNELLEAWDGSLYVGEKQFSCDIKQLCLRGTTLKNTDYIYGIAVYTGHNTKIMKNAKQPRSKMSGVLKKMNSILISVFLVQAFIVLTFSAISMKWQDQNGDKHTYIQTNSDISFSVFFIRYFTFLVAYSHLIPISLYVALELFKLTQTYLMKWDDEMYYRPLDKRANVRTSDLVEEIGQVEIIFSDKTGTLTMNEMEFKKCSVNLHVFGNNSDPTKIKNKFTINGESTAFEYLNDPHDNQNKQSLTDFFTLLAVCHTVIPDIDEDTKRIKYQASSPDELALVEGAAKMGFEFTGRTSSTIQIQLFTGEIEEWEVFAEFPFDSTRKRMSLLVKKRDSDAYLLMSKGADSIMLPRLTQDQNGLPVILRHLELFALDGLRTLMVAQKKLDPQAAQTIIKRFQLLKISNDPQKEDKLERLFNSVEQDLTFVGCTAIEDKLQNGVPETIATLMQAGIKIWVLTGDKQETAIEIAKSCRLIQAGMDTVILSSRNQMEFETTLDKNIAHYHVDLKGPITAINEESQNLVHRLTVVIDGSTLSYALEGDFEYRNKFFRLSLLANSVICCRVSPKQKADVVQLAKSYGPWTTLAVGDGANDVPMIREAHVGIGIYGKEGTQAARTADFSIGQFKYLKKLLLFHGRLGYKRISNFILYYFYKNVIMVFTELYFAFFNGFSGQVYFADWLPMLYNTLWTSWPPLIGFILEKVASIAQSEPNYIKDVSKDLSYQYPKLYRAGQKQYYFNMETFWTWMTSATFHGIVSFFLPVIGLTGVNDSSGQVRDHWWVSTISFTLLMHIVTYKLFLQTTFWHTYNISFSIFALGLYYGSLAIMSIDVVAKFLQPELNGILICIFSSFRALIVIIFAPFIAIGPDIIIQFVRRIVKPNPADRVLHLQKITKANKKKGLTRGLSQVR